VACGLSGAGHAGGAVCLGMTETRCPCPGLGHGRMQVGGGGPGRRCLRGVLLGLAKLGDRGGQGDELGDRGHGQEGAVAGQVPGECDQPGGPAQLVALAAALG
jgi:hypothetical protein